MLVEKLETVDAFVVFDFDDVECSVGVVRSAPKILVDGATWLARSQTYQLASFEQKVGGASAGVNAPPDGRAEAVARFVAEVEPWVSAGRLVIDAAKGVRPHDLESLRGIDPRPDDYWERADGLTAVGITASASAALGGLDGRTVAIEGFDAVGVQLAAQVVAQGGSVVSVGTSAGTAAQDTGFEPATLAGEWAQRGVDLVRELEAEPAPAGSVLGATADLLVCGSRAGVIDHGIAAGCSAKVIAPSGAIPVTAKALAVLHRAGVCVLPDFLTVAGPLVGGLEPALAGRAPGPSLDETGARIAAVVSEVLDDEQGPVLGACRRAEAFMRTWRTDLPFGRPLA